MDYGLQSNIWARIRVQSKRYIAAIRRIWWLLPLTVSLGTCVAAWVVAQMPPAYQSSGTLIYAGQYTVGNGIYNEQLANYFGTQMTLMSSPQVRDEALTRLQTLHPELKPDSPSLKVSQQTGTAIITLKATAKDPLYAQVYLEGCMQAYLNEKKRIKEDNAGATTVGLSKEMDHLQQIEMQAEVEMLAFEKANNVGYLEQEGNNAAKYLEQLNQQLADLKSNYNLLGMMDLDQSLDHQQTQDQASVTTTTTQGSTTVKPGSILTDYGPIADYQKARQQIALLKSQLAELSHWLKPKHPDIVSLNQQIQRQEDTMATLRQQSQEELKTHRETMAVQMKNLQIQIEQQQHDALALSGTLAEFNRLKTKSDRAKAEYTQLLANYHSIDVSKNVDQEPLTVLDHASKSISVKPGLGKIFFAGLGGGLLVGLIALFVIDQSDDRISSLMEMQTHFPQQLLGQIPEEKFQQGRALLRADDDRQAMLESFRTLRSSIIFLPVEGKRPKTIAVTSALPTRARPPSPPTSPSPWPSPGRRPSSSTPTCAGDRSAASSAPPTATGSPTSCCSGSRGRTASSRPRPRISSSSPAARRSSTPRSTCSAK